MMDKDIIVASWMSNNDQNMRTACLHIEKIDSDGLEFKIQPYGGVSKYAFQVIVPPDHDDYFLIYSLEDRHHEFDAILQSVNEKIQNVSLKNGGKEALEMVLDHIVHSFGGSNSSTKHFEAAEKQFSLNTSVTNCPQLQAVVREFKNISAAILRKDNEFIQSIGVELPDESDVCKWHVHIKVELFKDGGPLYQDLKEYAAAKARKDGKNGSSGILMEVAFPKDYLFMPPFMRVVRPRFKFHTGHVTIGGSVCMEALTPSGWLPSFCMESMLVQVQHAMAEGGGRLELHDSRDYSLHEAQAAFDRVARDHGWMN